MQLLGREVGLDQPFFLIAGPCVVESEELQLRTAETLKGITDKLGILFIFKSSFDKANRSSDKSFRGPGMDEGLRILEKVRDALGVPMLTDVHDIPQIAPVAEVVDVLQTPAFLARQTDFIHAVAASGKPVNIKKAQFMAPHDMKNVVDKARNAAQAAGVNEETIMVCERGVSFGYNNLVSDMRSLSIMRETGCPVVFDATHSRAAAGRAGDQLGRSARVRAGACARGRRDGRRRPVHGNASRSGQRQVGRPERLAARSDGKLADDAGRARPAGEAARLRGSVALGRTAFRPRSEPVFLLQLPHHHGDGCGVADHKRDGRAVDAEVPA